LVNPKNQLTRNNSKGIMYLVTGGAGFIGSHIVETLVKQKRPVRVIDNLCSGTRDNLKAVINKVEFIKGDIRDVKTVQRAMRGVKYVLHQAALTSVPKSINNPREFNEVNVQGTLNLLVAAQQAGVKRFVFASSSSVYGDVKQLPQRETFIPDPISPYALTKFIGEKYCGLFYRTFGLPTIALRYYNVFGARQKLDSQYAVVIPKFISCLTQNEPPPIYGDGKQTRDFTYIDNTVEANLRALDAPQQAIGLSFNVAGGQPCTVSELVRILNQLMSKNIKPVFHKSRTGDIKHSRADISWARKYLNFDIQVDFRTGLQHTIDWFTKEA
jgi:nucleoside-diphosphate-sugar epimerase